MPFQHRLICGDVLEVLPNLGRFKCLIADPPDNIGQKYTAYNDALEKREYENKLRRWIWAAKCAADISWISFNAKYVFFVGRVVDDLTRACQNYEARLFIQSFTFGQNRDSDCGNGYRPILRIRRKQVKLHPENIKVPSWRQENGDKRAREGGRVPLDHWADFPRITGNCKERRAWHPTQLREGMIERMVKLSTTPGEPVCDVFSGTGTVLRAVGDRNPITSIEIDPTYCQKIACEHCLGIENLC